MIIINGKDFKGGGNNREIIGERKGRISHFLEVTIIGDGVIMNMVRWRHPMRIRV